ncbi:dihydroneopterin aldolase [Aureibacillus halotolerans]|uniref:7,8-dihydroneopterin aldolase n=1 Tax=Aureibacillus halotolerans TaxID=1508390 RepID=A0A4R6TSP5_9BACI|nr:dihydroneopterin aldolase [Aureibacillus halotolerans]TDQ34203.1 dihydroneopterin aldolase [Aureibacillus halotolerans]
MDKIIVKGMSFYGYHGVFSEENKLGQRFLADIELYCDLRAAGENDDLQQTVNYAAIFETVQKVIEGEPVKLLEALAERIAANIFSKFEIVDGLSLRIIKPDPPIPGHYEHVAIEIERMRSTS